MAILLTKAGPAAPGGDPSTLSGLTLWLDASFGLFQENTGAAATTPAAANNDPVGTWKARTGQYFTAAAAGNRPLLQIGANGKPWLLGDGTDDYLTSGGGPAVAEPCTVLYLYRHSTPAVSDTSVFTGHTAAGGLKIKGRNGSVNTQQSGRDGVANFGVSNTTLADATWAWGGSTFATPAGAGAGVFQFNNAADGTVTTSAVAVTGNPRVFASFTPGEFHKGGIAQLVIYNRVLSAVELASLYGWSLTQKPT